MEDLTAADESSLKSELADTGDEGFPGASSMSPLA
jgi:hypothetical protein